MNGKDRGVPSFLHLHSTFSAGGKEIRCAQLINAFGPKIGHSIVSALPERMEAAELISDDIPVDYPKEFPPLQGSPLPNRLYHLAKAMTGHDLVLTYNWGAMDAVLAHRLFGRQLALPPLIHHEDGFNEDERDRLKPARNLFRRIALARASALIVPSQQLERIALEIWRQPPVRVTRIPNGINIAAFAHRPEMDALSGLQKQPGEKWIGTLAGLRKVKNIPRLVRAFAQLPDAMKAEWRLVIVGEGPERAAIRGEAERLGISDRVHLPGFAANPARYAGLFDIFALSSDSEQFPISAVEAMAAGLPVAAPAVGDLAGMVSKENAPFVTDPSDENALGNSLQSLVKHADLRKKIGNANRVRALANYDEKVMIAAYRQIYFAAMGKATAADSWQ